MTLPVTESDALPYRFYEDHPAIQAISGYALTEVERSLYISSPTDVLFYTAPVGAFAWESSPALQSYTRKVVSYARTSSITARDATLSALRAPLDLFTPGPTPLDILYASIAEAIEDPLFNLTSTLTEPARVAFGPEWEWTARDLVVFVPQPSCPVPFLTPDMSTMSSLGKCGLGLERATLLDSFVPIYSPPPTHVTDVPTLCLKSIESADALARKQGVIWLARCALVMLALFGQGCGECRRCCSIDFAKILSRLVRSSA